jgi:hypothetical protein
MAEVFHGVLGARLDAAQWERAVRRSLEAESFFPPPAVLLRYGLADGVPEARAVEVYDRIVSAFERGHELGPREVAAEYGTAAMEAFCAAGGTRAFAWCEPRDEPFRRKAFVEGWVETASQDPGYALPPGPTSEPPLLEPTTEPGPSKAEATSILAQIAERAR